MPGCANPGGCMSSTNISFGAPSHTAFTLFAASRATVHMTGGFWTLGGSQRMTETIVDANGTRIYIYMIQIACTDPHTTMNFI